MSNNQSMEVFAGVKLGVFESPRLSISPFVVRVYLARDWTQCGPAFKLWILVMSIMSSGATGL
jgi:hypothetical protein